MFDKYHNPQLQLAVLATLFFFVPTVVHTSLHYSSFWPSCIWLILPLALPTLFIYILAPFLFPAAVITIYSKFEGDVFLLIEGKKHQLSPYTPQVKIFFWRSGIHKIFLVNMVNNKPIISASSPEEVNTYGQSIVYIEFDKDQSPQATS